MGKKYFVKNPDTGMVLDVKGGNADSGAEICLWSPHGGDNQLWKYKNGMLYSVKNKRWVLLCWSLAKYVLNKEVRQMLIIELHIQIVKSSVGPLLWDIGPMFADGDFPDMK